jgi:hypothetical protein
VLNPCFVGVVLGNCIASGTHHDLFVHNPSGYIVALTETTVVLDGARLQSLPRSGQ